MTKRNSWRVRAAVSIIITGCFGSGNAALGQNTWTNSAGGLWGTNSNWSNGSPPTVLQQAAINLPGAYTVSFNAPPSNIRELTVSGAVNATLASSGPTTITTLHVTSSLFEGPQDVVVSGGASLTLGNFLVFTNRPLHLNVGHELNVQAGSTLNVRVGSDVVTPALLSAGQLTVAGAGSTLTAGSAEFSEGSLNVTTGGVLQTAGADVVDAAGAVSGAGSLWTDTGEISIGRSGEGALNITAGGKVQSFSGRIGRGFSGVAVATVSGANSQWNISTELSVGSGQGTGTLNVAGGGSVTCTDGFVGRSTFAHGTATITGGAWTMTGRLSLGGENGAIGTLNLQPAGIVSAAQGVVIFPDSVVNMQGGTLDASAISFEGAQGNQFQWTSGTLHVGTFNGNLVNSGGLLAPGHSPGSTTVTGNYTQHAGGDLEIEIGGALAASGFDFLSVSGNAALDGDLNLKLINGFVPTSAQTFAILISNGLSGAFDNAASGQRVMLADGSGSFLVNYGPGSSFNPNQVVLSAFQTGFTADFNLDGRVDGGDLAEWEGDFGQNSFSDADNDGESDGSDFLAWQRQFGGGVPAVTSLDRVPEPKTTWMLSMAALVLVRKLVR